MQFGKRPGHYQVGSGGYRSLTTLWPYRQSYQDNHRGRHSKEGRGCVATPPSHWFHLQNAWLSVRALVLRRDPSTQPVGPRTL
ncbi:hypothetical protein TcWFU_005133 [Taenia crassiceps]|uniref:Uncharacterized protein n=1 Tax=Taenia crassiceps TaxID=6207 RepID=A0ABR4Q9C4_9CEST